MERDVNVNVNVNVHFEAMPDFTHHAHPEDDPLPGPSASE